MRRRNRRRRTATHFRALLLEDGLSRKPATIDLDREYLYQHLVAFVEFIANGLDAMLSHFADVQQAVGAGNDLDECAEVRQPSDFTEIRLADFGGRCDVPDHLQRL